jgi:hypothetical protein
MTATNYQTDRYNVNYILKITDPLSVEQSYLIIYFLLEDGRTTVTCSSVSSKINLR